MNKTKENNSETSQMRTEKWTSEGACVCVRERAAAAAAKQGHKGRKGAMEWERETLNTQLVPDHSFQFIIVVKK